MNKFNRQGLIGKAQKQKVINFLKFLRENNLVRTKVIEGVEGYEITLVPALNVMIEYKDRAVLEICEYGLLGGVFDSAMVIALDGREHFLEEVITPKTLKYFKVFKEFYPPK